MPAIGAGRSGRLLVADAGRSDGCCKGSCVLCSWSSVSRLSLPWPLVNLDTSVAHSKAICSVCGILRQFSSIAGCFGDLLRCAVVLAAPGSGQCAAGHGSTIARAAGFCTAFRLLGRSSLSVLGMSSWSLFKLRFLRKGTPWTHGRFAAAAVGQNFWVLIEDAVQIGNESSIRRIFCSC